MITRQVRLQLVAFGIIAVLGLVFTGGRYAGLGNLVPGHDKGYLVYADFPDSGGIFTGAEVNYRGIMIGKVETLDLISPDAALPKGGVKIGMRLKPGTKVPGPSCTATTAAAKQCTLAKVDNRSAVGEQYVELEPQVDTAPYMKAGDTIGAAQTILPVAPADLIGNLNSLVTSVNTGDVTTVLDQLGQAFNGSGDDLQRLIDAGNALTTTATQYLPQTLQLIKDSQPVLDTQRQVASDFKSYNKNLASLTAQLRASDPDFRSLYTQGTSASQQVTNLLEENRAQLPPFLSNLVFTAQVQAVRIPALRQIIVTYPNVVAGGFTVTPGDGTAHFGFVTNMNGPPCPTTDPGYATTHQREPSDITPREPNLTAHCSTTSGTTPRGADHAPRAEGLKPYPADRSQAVNQSALFGGATDTSGYSTGIADYDPTTGHAITSTGQTFTLASTARASSLFGAESWEWLLMNPLSS